jgi:biopolymer transport protein ExbB
MTTQRRSYETGHKPKCLVIVDDTAEWDRAVYYASRWAIRVGGGVVMLRVIETEDQNQQWLGVADIMRAGLKMAPEGKEMTEEAMFAEIARVNGDMQGRISYLSVLGVCTPMIGLVGTVVGMMEAFDTLGTSGVGDPSKLAGAIGHVLVATASGLAVAIPSFIFYYLIRNRIADNLHDLGELVTNRFRGFPYDEVAGKTDEIGAEPPIAAAPVWNAAPETAAKA